MEPLTVRAHLQTPCIPRGGLMLDACLLYGMGATMGRADPLGWVDPVLVEAAPLPVARVETEHGWWWATSDAMPEGVERVTYAHRRPPVAWYELWTSEKSVNIAAGPDKGLRVPLYYRPDWMVIEWTCVGEAEEVARLLSYVPGVGHRTTHGWGLVQRWQIERGGPDLARYAWDVSLRHLPVDAAGDPLPSRVRRVPMPLRSPYYRRDRAVPCLQAAEVPHE